MTGSEPNSTTLISATGVEPDDDSIDDSLILWMLSLSCEQRLRAAQDLADAAWRLSLGDHPER